MCDRMLFTHPCLQGAYTNVDVIRLSREYLDLVAQHPVPMRMVRGHMHNMLGKWLTEYTHIRDIFNVPRPDLQAYMAVSKAAVHYRAYV